LGAAWARRVLCGAAWTSAFSRRAAAFPQGDVPKPPDALTPRLLLPVAISCFNVLGYCECASPSRASCEACLQYLR
jgi:hypothetical protein